MPFLKGICKMRTGYLRMADADGKMRMGKCGQKNANGKMRIEKKNRTEKIAAAVTTTKKCH